MVESSKGVQATGDESTFCAALLRTTISIPILLKQPFARTIAAAYSV
jgi:hypothetical protein